MYSLTETVKIVQSKTGNDKRTARVRLFHIPRKIDSIFKTSEVFLCPPCKSPKRTTLWGKVKCDQKKEVIVQLGPNLS